jgi:hypothetical protein
MELSGALRWGIPFSKGGRDRRGTLRSTFLDRRFQLMRHARCDFAQSQTRFMGLRKNSCQLAGALKIRSTQVSQIPGMQQCAVFGFTVRVTEVSRPATRLIIRS